MSGQGPIDSRLQDPDRTRQPDGDVALDHPSGRPESAAWSVHALFQQRLAGDEALLQLARLRFAQSGLAAELYASSPGDLQAALAYVAPHPRLPIVHLSRDLNVLHERDRALVGEFAGRFAGRVSGLVVHDKAEMRARTDDLLAALRELGGRLVEPPEAPMLFLEYAAGLEPGWFVEVAERLQDVEHVSLCIDVGHLGIREASQSFMARHPDLPVQSLSPEDDRLPGLVEDVQRAVDDALPAVLRMTHSLGRLGKPVHLHLHDGHPLIRGLSDHFSFLTQLPVPFRFRGRASLDPMYGPAGLSRILAAGVQACGLDRVSFTLEIHQAEGRLPLGDAAGLFRHWQDTTNAERMNHWLSVLAQNGMLASASILAALASSAVRASPDSGH